ncbi:hypothetical protein BDV37DRAFT_240735 [Aspergillus pseudonomiae]|uniref:Uncharacterized protein n=1 Tax=Aspergillus pseudonomiae TaxID=1506151 RepID=A0A5N7DMJ6_9EURO|nr:uncharacterized protein BDV37DRAFT_240735 [Aspergillus pseudonomiae]KAE8407671.1 hypothetical protein BDV37DRAFT_240735 [Aspergillus pseudonomiae]
MYMAVAIPQESVKWQEKKAISLCLSVDKGEMLPSSDERSVFESNLKIEKTRYQTAHNCLITQAHPNHPTKGPSMKTYSVWSTLLICFVSVCFFQ